MSGGNNRSKTNKTKLPQVSAFFFFPFLIDEPILFLYLGSVE